MTGGLSGEGPTSHALPGPHLLIVRPHNRLEPPAFQPASNLSNALVVYTPPPRPTLPAQGAPTTDGEALAPTTGRDDVARLQGRHTGRASDRGSLFSLQCQALSGARGSDGAARGIDWSSLRLLVDLPALPLGRPEYTPQEAVLATLDDLRRLAQDGQPRHQLPHLTAACASFARDSAALERAHGHLRAADHGREHTRPVGQLDVRSSYDGWMRAMTDMAGYRKQLTPDRLGALTQLRDASGLHHNFTQVKIEGHATPVFLHNTKAANGEGATRVMSFARPGPGGVWQPFVPSEAARAQAYARSAARDELRDLEPQIAKLKGAIKNNEDKLALQTNDKAKQGIGRTIQRLTEELTPLTRRQQELTPAAQSAPLTMLDLSYDDLHVGLKTLCKANRWSEQDLATALLHLLGDHSERGAALVARLDRPVTIEGIKVKDLVDPRQNTATGTVSIRGGDLCMTLMSIMFLTEPKHALPMATANRDALRAVKHGVLPLSSLFDPIELSTRDGALGFRTGQLDHNLGALLASANNLRTTLDPSRADTRRIKERAMPLTEQLATAVEPASLRATVAHATGPVLLGSPAEHVDERQAALLFPLLKSLAIRTMLEQAGVRS